MEKKLCDVLIIGAGPGGYVAAIKAAQNGLQTILVDKGDLGGVCLNVGCIPTKALVASSQSVENIKKASQFGIEIVKISFDYAKMKTRKDEVVQKLRNGLKSLILANKITLLSGEAKFLSPREVKVIGQDNVVIQAKNIIIATGSIPMNVPAFPCDGERIHDSTSMLEITKLPERLAIIGGGYIGCEFACIFARLGVQVTILEAMPQIVAMQGETISNALAQSLKKQGIIIKTNVFVSSINKHKSHLEVLLKNSEKVDADMVLVSIGRKIISDNLDLQKAGVVTTPKGAIPVDSHMKTNVENIYAIGDVTGEVMLAHVASHQGIVAVENILGRRVKMHYNAIPAVIFTSPEVASVGLTLAQAKEKGKNAESAKFPLQALGKAVSSGDTEGFVEIIYDPKTGEIFGAHMIGHEASALIGEMALAIANELTIDCIHNTVHAHPTLPEAWMEVALIADNQPIHLPPRR